MRPAGQIGNLVRRIRKGQRLTQAQLGEKAGLRQIERKQMKLAIQEAGLPKTLVNKAIEDMTDGALLGGQAFAAIGGCQQRV